MQGALHRFALGLPADWATSALVADGLALGVVLVLTLAVGVCLHELLHLVPLSLVGAGYTVTVLPDEGGAAPADDSTPWTVLGGALTGGLVRVEVTRVPDGTPEWVLRAAALLPVALALPLALVAAGALPNPVAVGDRVGTVALVALTACGLPSPADWSVVWYGSRLADE